MSKQCPYCKSKKVGSFNDEVAVCTECHRVFGKSQLVDTTLFDHITASPEVLAEASVYQNYIGLWCSPFIQWGKDTKAEAVAAAVIKLKEVRNDQATD